MSRTRQFNTTSPSSPRPCLATSTSASKCSSSRCLSLFYHPFPLFFFSLCPQLDSQAKAFILLPPSTFFVAYSFCLSNDSKKCVVRTSMRLTECWRPFRRSSGRGDEGDGIGGRRRGRDQCRCRFWNPGFPPSVVKTSSDSCSRGGVSCLIQLPRTQLLHPRASDHRRIIYTQKKLIAKISC